ncbi:type IV pili methyl-accepting chemotaxis transducer N-terminal domain-containing protein [Methylophilus aquaticus]|uniref:Type IV pili methyl-accepting chemotaxis transducer N-terminal domain-containing protein n=2 Tax=Methylophilus aquaticus TaxID=1971610 RepID=A0ABT9JQW6_9PROT|nr:type IV pili methyl-accepting chemotaxis transducer N-terminal domain-containing protein [Methylophilus aquaticus]
MNAFKKTDKPTQHAMINSDLMVALINLSGRQRMLSQRIVLNILFSAHQPQAIVQAKEALTLFVQTHTLLVNGNHEYPGICFDALEKVLFGPDHNEAKIQQFIQRCTHAIDTFERSASLPESVIQTLGEEAGMIVTILNQVTMTYEHESKRCELVRRKKQESLMHSIQKIAKEAKIVSFNAQVIAARSGSAGKEFAVVASVMTDITNEIEQLVAAAMTST